jgi:hypothetical protein
MLPPIPEMPPTPLLLATMTKEPFQPVRLYYDIPGRGFVGQRLAALRCMSREPLGKSWQWLYLAEAEGLTFFAGHADVPEEVQPIILGRFRFPRRGGMVVELNSLPRAIEAARFFGPILGEKVVLRRARVVNRCFAAAEGEPEALMKELDRNVTVIDPAKAERDLAEDLKGVRTLDDLERASAARMERQLKSKKDVPLVEDFPLAPEEETPNFGHLAMTLQLRLVRAVEHWRGNTHLTLTAIIMQMVEQSDLGRDAR